MTPAKQIYVAIVGVGGVGKAFLGQLDHLSQRLAKQSTPINLSLILVRRSTKQIFSKDFTPLNLSTVLSDLDKSSEPLPSFSQTPGSFLLFLACVSAREKEMRRRVHLVWLTLTPSCRSRLL